MNRPIELRAWAKWNGDGKYRMWSWEKDSQEICWYLCGESSNGWSDVTILQYSGLKDINGIKIYEGDILLINDIEDNSKCEVIFHEGAFKRSYLPFITEEEKFEDFYEKDFIHYFIPLDSTMWKIIGNKYENENLIPK